MFNAFCLLLTDSSPITKIEYRMYLAYYWKITYLLLKLVESSSTIRKYPLGFLHIIERQLTLNHGNFGFFSTIFTYPQPWGNIPWGFHLLLKENSPSTIRKYPLGCLLSIERQLTLNHKEIFLGVFAEYWKTTYPKS